MKKELDRRASEAVHVLYDPGAQRARNPATMTTKAMFCYLFVISAMDARQTGPSEDAACPV